MLGIRQKLSLGFGGLLLIILIIGIQSIIQLTRLGASIDVILRENYRSVIACQEMKEALERIDSGILFTLLGYSREGTEFIRKNESVFEKALQSEEATVIDAQTQRLLSDTLTLAKQLGAMVFTYKGEDVADTILRFAREYRVGHIVIGSPGNKPLWKRFGKNRDIVNRLIRNDGQATVIILDTRSEKLSSKQAVPEASQITKPAEPIQEPPTVPVVPLLLSGLLSPGRIVIWDQPVLKDMVLRTLVEAIGRDSGMDNPEALYLKVMKREDQGSTFFNEGVAFPHARVSDLTAPAVAVGLSKQGIEDVKTDKPIEIVFLILSPEQTPDTQVEILGLCSRAAQSRQLLQNLGASRTPEEAMKAICDWETRNEACVTNSIS